MKTIAKFLLVIAISSATSYAHADLVVIAHPNSGLEKLSRDEVINYYMGRNKKLSSGITVMPIDLDTPENDKANFYQLMVKKSLPEINSYWARLTFSGQGAPPVQVRNAAEVLDIVANNRGAIAYIDRKYLDKRVKLIFDPTQ